jgi:hypothetical protein
MSEIAPSFCNPIRCVMAVPISSNRRPISLRVVWVDASSGSMPVRSSPGMLAYHSGLIRLYRSRLIDIYLLRSVWGFRRIHLFCLRNVRSMETYLRTNQLKWSFVTL